MKKNNNLMRLNSGISNRTITTRMNSGIICLPRTIGIYLLLILALSWGINAATTAIPAGEQDDLKYNVSVSAHLVPFYAEDQDGNPVFDLKQEEIQLVVNKETLPIMSLNSFRFNSEEKKQDGPVPKPAFPDPRQTKKKDTGRYIFIVVDSIFNSSYGLKRANAICRDIISKSAPEDAFILMENLPDIGLKYITGPTHDMKQLDEAINKMNEIGLLAIKKQEIRFRNYGRQMKKYLVSNNIAMATENKEAFIDLSAQEASHARHIRARTMNARAKLLTRSLSQLQYALKTIERPKMVYLISSGVRTSVLGGDELNFYFKLLSKAAEAINRSGSLLYVVNSSVQNPNIPARYTGEVTLASLANSANGKYFSGNDIKKVASQISKSTAAYYEIAFSPNTDKTMDIEIRSKRSGIKIFTVTKTEKARPYNQMKKIQKKLFALSVVTGGSWARMAGKVKLLRYEKTGKASKNVDFSIRLPEQFQNKTLDSYIINIDPETQKADFKISQIKAESILNLKGKIKKNRRLYFVLIDPQTTTCMFNWVK